MNATLALSDANVCGCNVNRIEQFVMNGSQPTIITNSSAKWTFDSSVGRAEDCSGKCLESLGRWFKSGSKEIFQSGQ